MSGGALEIMGSISALDTFFKKIYRKTEELSYSFWPCHATCRILVPWPGTEPGATAVKNTKFYPLGHQGTPCRIFLLKKGWEAGCDFRFPLSTHWASLVAQQKKNLPAKAGDGRDPGAIPGSGWSPGEGNDNPLLCSCLGNPMDRGAWWSSVHGVAESQTWLSN